MSRRDGAGGCGNLDRRCLARGTLIETPSGAKPIEQLSAGDKVWGYHTQRGEPVIGEVTSLKSSVATETVTVCGLCVTPDHPVYVEGEWKPAGRLKPSDVLLAKDLTQRQVTDVKLSQGEVEVYDISVSGQQNFFAGGVLVHNQSTAAPPDG